MSRLAEIISHKRREIEPWLPHTDDWRKRARRQHGPMRNFLKTLQQSPFGFIAEVKKASPSAGVIAENFDPIRIAQQYAQAGTDCLSVLTDERFFHGHLDYLALVRRHAPQPILRKDFTLHEVQIYQALLAGADAVLFILAAIDDGQLRHFLEVAAEIKIDALVEVHTEQELERAIAAGAEFIGINNRDLTTFETHLGTTEKLAPKIPDEVYVISESGIRTEEDVARMCEAGVDGVLIGEALMRAENPGEALLRLRQAVPARN